VAETPATIIVKGGANSVQPGPPVIIRTLLAAVALAAIHGQALAAAPQPVKHYSIEQLMASETYSGVSFSPDNSKLLLTSSRTGIPNLYTMPAGGGPLTPVTHSTTDVISGIGWFPRDERILYSSDHGGDELNHIFVRETDGSVRDLTPGARTKAKFVGWAQDKTSFFLVTNERDPKYFDLYEYQADGYRRLLFTNDKAYQIEAVSPDRRFVALSRILDNATTEASLYDVEAKTFRVLSGAREVAKPQDFTPSGALLMTTDAGREFAYLVRYDLKTGQRQTVYQTDWDVVGAGASEYDPSEAGARRYIVLSVDEDARNTIRLLDAQTLKPVALPDLGPGAVHGFSLAHGEPEAVVTLANGDTPGDLYQVDLKTGARKLLHASLSPEVTQSDLVPGQVIHFKSYDGLSVPGVLYVPRDAQKGRAGPAIVFVHGGPGDESEVGYKPSTQFYVNHGYVVFEINNRGSRGSGKTFYHLDDHKHGDADLDDVVAAKKMLADTGYVDPGKVAIMGQSYGGYMVLAGLTFRPEAFAAGVDLYGVSNWVRLLPHTPPWWEDLRRLLATEMGDWTKPEELQYLKDISPSFHADRIVRPLMVLQGANDPRVLPVESEDIIAKVKAKGVPTEYVKFPDEGHGFRKKANQIAAYEAILAFLDKYVRDAATAPPKPRQHDILDFSQ
jgi:dipeptidyl aminopeptidase/acylaminoacyl peptidase